MRGKLTKMNKASTVFEVHTVKFRIIARAIIKTQGFSLGSNTGMGYKTGMGYNMKTST